MKIILDGRERATVLPAAQADMPVFPEGPLTAGEIGRVGASLPVVAEEQTLEPGPHSSSTVRNFLRNSRSDEKWGAAMDSPRVETVPSRHMASTLS